MSPGLPQRRNGSILRSFLVETVAEDLSKNNNKTPKAIRWDYNMEMD